MGFEYEEWGNFPVMGLFGDEFVPLLSEGEDVHQARPDKFAKLVMDSEDNYDLSPGEVLSLGSGYALEAKQVDVDGRKVWLEFTRNGEFVDDEIVGFSYGQSSDWILDLDDIENEYHVVVLRVHVNEVFQGAVNSIAQIDGLWLIDYDNAFTIDIDDEFGEFEVTEIEGGVTGENPKFAHLELRNKDSIHLDKDSVQNILSGIKLRIADSDTLRFYPFVEAGPDGTEVVYRGCIEEGGGYRLNNYVIEITDVFVEANTASYYVLKGNEKIKTGLLDAGESMEFDFEGDGKVRMHLIYVHEGSVLPGVMVEITVSGYDVNDLYANGVIKTGSPSGTYTMHLQKGWNLISTPIIPTNPDVNSVFGYNEDVILPIYAWSPENRQYYSADIIGIGNGYWVLALDDTEVTFKGTSYSM